MKPAAPEFPLRVIFDDGDVMTIESPEALMAEIDSIDSTSASGQLWIRDDLDRTVVLRMSGGAIYELRVLP